MNPWMASSADTLGYEKVLKFTTLLQRRSFGVGSAV